MKVWVLSLLISFCITVLLVPSMGYAVERAPRISDKEIIESLATLKEGQRSLNKRIDQVETSLNQRIDRVESSLNQRFDDLKWFLGTMI